MLNNWQPQWTTQVRIESGGRYPLGVNRFHDGLEEILIKSIINQANRLRYITYSCWAIGDIEKRESGKEYSDFVEAFRRRENALGLGLFIMGPEYSVPGSNVLLSIVSDGVKNYDCSFDLMASNELGAYGLYYKGTIYNMGLTESDEKGIITLTELGRELYNVAERYYSNTNPEYYRKYSGKRRVPSSALLEWGKINDFNNIRKPSCREEREFYKSLIYRLASKTVADYRRDTFTFFMYCIDECTNTDTIFNEDILRNINYYSEYYNNKHRIIKYSIPEYFKDVYFYWFIYEGHVYFRWWLELYFDAFLQFLKSRDNGALLDDFFLQIDQSEFNSTIKSFCKRHLNYYNSQMSEIFALFSKPSKLSDPFSEEAITKDESHTSISAVIAKFLLMMVNLITKYKEVRSDTRYQYLFRNLGSDLWFESLFHFSNIEKMPVIDFLKYVLKRYIIQQHDFIMMDKDDLRRCWFTTENQRYFFQADVSPLWRPAKYDTIIHFLFDMKLIDTSKDIVRLSTEGKSFLKILQRDYY